MTATEIIRDLRRRGVELQAQGDRLRFRPKEAVTPDLLALLVQYKPKILAALSSKARVRGRDETVEAGEAEVCWHCGGGKACRCALCAIPAPAMGWGEGQCRACMGSGYLTWPRNRQ